MRTYSVGDDLREPWRAYVVPDPIAPTEEWHAWPYGSPQYWDPIRQIWVRGLGTEFRYRNYNPATAVVMTRTPTLQVVGGRIHDVREVQFIDDPSARTIVQLRMDDGRLTTVDLGRNVDPLALGLRPGREVIFSGDRLIVDGTPMVAARHMVVEREPVLADRRPVRDEIVIAEQQLAPFEPQPLGYIGPDELLLDSDRPNFRSLISDWPAESQRMAHDMFDKYGSPQEYTKSMLFWHDNGPWRRTVVHRVPVPHDEPPTHLDVIAQTIGYRVSTDELSRAHFGSHLVIDPVRGEVTAFCHNEAANFLTINLMHDVLTGRMSADEARREFERQMRGYEEGYRSDAMREFRFRNSAK